MNFKRYHVSKNLFDENAIGDIYPDPNSSTIRTGIVISDLEINSDYYFNFDVITSAQIFYARFNGDVRLDTSAFNTREPVLIPMTGANSIRFWVGENKSWNGVNNIVLSKSSSAIPYEPYGNTWTNTPHYIHNTSTDTLTALPAVLYPNDTSVTVEITGNTGGVGDLVESGEHAGEYIIPIINNGVAINVYNATALDVSETLSATIPTTDGANTLSIGTTLQPSEVSVTYKGWHLVADVHERESGAWT